jgi:TolB protein
VLDPPTWRFTTGQTRLLFIGRDNQNHDQLMSITPAGGTLTALTQEPFGVWDYSVSTDGSAIVYAAMRQDGGSDLVTIAPDGRGRRKVLDCPQAMCNGAAWFPDGKRLVYERHTLPAPGAFPAPGRLWLLNLETGQTEPVFQDSQKLGFGPHVSPDGQWLAYFAPSEQAVQLYRLSDGRNLMVPSQMGEPPAWSPRGDAVAMSNILFMGERTAVHLFRVDVDSNSVTDISVAPNAVVPNAGDENVDDGAPDWSPDGEWIAFRRRSPAAAMSAQIWVMRRDGTQARQLTDDEYYDHSGPTWSPDGRTLAIQRFPLDELNASPGIWRLDVATGQLRELVTPGTRPTWLP